MIEALALPHVWILAVILLALGVRSFRRREWPPADDFVELVAFGGALWGVRVALTEVLAQHGHVDAGLAQGAGVVLLALAAARGIWRTLTRAKDVRPEVDAKVTPKDDGSK